MPFGSLPLVLKDNLQSCSYTKCYVFGPYGSGTNLMKAYLEKYFTCDCEQDHTVWKHAFDWDLSNCRRPDENSTTLKIVILKHPVFWIRSMLKSPYDFHAPNQTHFANPNSPVIWSRRGKRKTFPNAMSYWNATVNHYLNDQYFRRGTCVVLYQDLLYRPIEVLKQLEKVLARSDLPLCPIYSSAKCHCNASDRARALRTYSLRTREKAREMYRIPDKDQELVKAWESSDSFVANSSREIKDDWNTSIKMVHRRKKPMSGPRYLQRFDDKGLLV